MALSDVKNAQKRRELRNQGIFAAAMAAGWAAAAAWTWRILAKTKKKS